MEPSSSGQQTEQVFRKGQGWEGNFGCFNTIFFHQYCTNSHVSAGLSVSAFSPKVIQPLSTCIPEFSRKSAHSFLILILDWSLHFISIHLSSSFYFYIAPTCCSLCFSRPHRLGSGEGSYVLQQSGISVAADIQWHSNFRVENDMGGGNIYMFMDFLWIFSTFYSNPHPRVIELKGRKQAIAFL